MEGTIRAAVEARSLFGEASGAWQSGRLKEPPLMIGRCDCQARCRWSSRVKRQGKMDGRAPMVQEAEGDEQLIAKMPRIDVKLQPEKTA